MRQNGTIKIGVIGMGRRMSCGNVASLLRLKEEGITIAAVADPNRKTSLDWMRRNSIPTENVTFYDDADEMLEKEKLDGVMIGTRCNLHAQMAEKVIQQGLPLFLEKPVFINEEGQRILTEAGQRLRAPVEVSFPLRMTALVARAKSIIDSGTLGTISQVSVINTPAYGRGYFKKWHKFDALTGGLFLQKATHDFDLVFYLTGTKPVRVCGMKTRTVMGGDMPRGLTCDECEKRKTCPESDWVLENKFLEPPQPHNCVFSQDVEIEDAGGALVLLDSGASLVYSQCFVARKSAGLRLYRFVGFKATLELEFISGSIKVIHHRDNEIETYTYQEAAGHFGGDEGLMEAFVHLLRGEECSYPSLTDGMISANLCLTAKRSAERERFLEVAPFPPSKEARRTADAKR